MNRKAHVLVVDDDKDIRRLILATLGSTFYDLQEVSSGSEALAYLNTHDYPNLIILDLMLPDYSGFDILSRLKNDPDMAMILVVVLSANADVNRDRLLQLGANAVFPKPFSPLDLLKTVEDLLG